MLEQTNTGQPVAAPVVDGQAPAVDTGVVAPATGGQADPATVVTTPPQVEVPSTPQQAQAEVKVDESSVAGNGMAGNEFGTWEEQNKSLRAELEKKSLAYKEMDAKYQELEKNAKELDKWVQDYSPTLEYVLGDNANPELKKQVLEGMQNQSMTPQDIQSLVAKTLESHEAKKAEAAKAEGLKASQEQAYNSFMEANPEIRANPVLHQKLLDTMQSERFPLTANGYKAAKSIMGVVSNQPTQPDNTAQNQAVNNAILAGGQQSGSAGDVDSNHMFNLKGVSMP